MALNIPRVRHYLKSFALEKLFIEELGWDRHTARLSVQAGEGSYVLEGVAEKRGVQIFRCNSDPNGTIPDYSTRLKIEKQVTKSAYEHLIIFTDANETTQVWQWVSRQPGQPAAYREHNYQAQHQIGDSLIQKLEAISFTLNEEEGLTLTGVVFRLHDAFDRDRVTKRFYDLFKKEHDSFLDFIVGITEQGDNEWYASLMLNRLMFVYFIQRKGFLDEDWDYLKNRLKMVQDQKGKGKFLTFYRLFLVRLFHEGFSQQPAQRKPDLEELLGSVPYLDGGLFELHELEQKHPDIDIPDEAFERLFDFFDQYEWTLDTRPLRDDNEINPDVLGYIFEKYVNQKQMGAYYTKEDITEYISKNTIIPFLFDAAEKKCAIAFQHDSALWQLLRNDPDRYIYPAVRKGVIDENGDIVPLPDEIEKGVHNVKERGVWNSPADPEYALPTENWREHVARRQRCLEIREKLSKGEVHQINDLITYNLNIRQLAQDAISDCEGPELLRAFYRAISTVTMLDPTCGSGAFLFAALKILEPLYESCLQRMQGFFDDLDRSGERHRPEKFSDFRRTLSEIERHPNRAYFILKSIIVNNLYGVDIMQEAVEICKLRLFLELVAQVDKVKHLEPLPDIDFNIRAGNTLIGFVTREDVSRTLEGKLAFNKELVDKINEEAEIVDRAFKRFHKMQIEQNMNSEDFVSAKKELGYRLKQLTKKLDRYTAVEYGIDSNNKNEYEIWHKNHQPFHWFAEFFGIMKLGGFDVIIGNPPYVEYGKIKGIYTIKGYKTENCSNLYAFIMESALNYGSKNGRVGMIVPLSGHSTKRMSNLIEGFYKKASLLHIINLSADAHPSVLFPGVRFRLSIFLFTTGQKNKSVFTTKYKRWFAEERDYLFKNIVYTKSNPLYGVILKMATPIHKIIISKLIHNKQTLGLRSGFNTIYYHNAPVHWIRSHSFTPYFSSDRDGVKKSTQLKQIKFESREQALAVSGILCSSTFFIWWITISDCYHLNINEIDIFPLDLSDASIIKRLSPIAERLNDDMIKKSKRRVYNYKTTGRVEYDEFYLKLSKPIIDEIDRSLAEYYSFTDEELDFILNYDIKYRMGIENFVNNS